MVKCFFFLTGVILYEVLVSTTVTHYVRKELLLWKQSSPCLHLQRCLQFNLRVTAALELL